MDNRTALVRVSGWSNPRFVSVDGNVITFEAMWYGCACPTCYARLDTVMNRVAESGIKWTAMSTHIPERGGEPSAVLVVEPKVMPEKVDAFLSGLLGLQVSEIVPAATPTATSLN